MIAFEVWGAFHIDDYTLANLFTTEEGAMAWKNELDFGKHFYIKKCIVYDGYNGKGKVKV